MFSGDAVEAEEDVLRGQVPVHDPEGLAVRSAQIVSRLQTLRRLRCDVHAGLDGRQVRLLRRGAWRLHVQLRAQLFGGGGVPLDPDPIFTLGHAHTCARWGTRVSCWGSNAHGQLGVDDIAARVDPASVPGFEDVREISAGDRHTCVATSDGVVRCVGANERGQLGDGTRIDRSAVVDVALDGPAAQVALGTALTCALMTDRTITCWGRNDQGQLGDGTRTDRDTPMPVLAP